MRNARDFYMTICRHLESNKFKEWRSSGASKVQSSIISLFSHKVITLLKMWKLVMSTSEIIISLFKVSCNQFQKMHFLQWLPYRKGFPSFDHLVTKGIKCTIHSTRFKSHLQLHIGIQFHLHCIDFIIMFSTQYPPMPNKVRNYKEYICRLKVVRSKKYPYICRCLVSNCVIYSWWAIEHYPVYTAIFRVREISSIEYQE